MPGGDEAVRFLDVLTTASSVARACAAEAVEATHLLDAIDVLTGAARADDVAGSVSPLGHRRSVLSVEPAVRELTQRWFARLGETPDATVEGDALSELRAEIEALVRS